MADHEKAIITPEPAQTWDEVRLPGWDPVGGARVWLLKQAYRDGRKQWDRLNTAALANEAGGYRFSNLRPGRYIVQALHLSPIADNRYGDRGPKMKSVPAYHRNASSE
jgi:hypothetical protein